MPLLVNRIFDVVRSLKTLGFIQTTRYVALRALPEKYLNQTMTFQPRNSLHKLACRGGTSDGAVFKQVFIDAEYSPLLGLANVNTVVDCGANVGYSAAWFLSAFPTCEIIALEPERSNYEALQRNLAPFGDRAKCLQAAVWSESTSLELQRRDIREGHEWSWQVRKASASRGAESASVPAFSVSDLLLRFSLRRVSILKMDIEGAEAVIFSAMSVREWLGQVDAIAIELHDNVGFGSATEAFFSAIADQDLQHFRSGELIICRRH
jgi:FkbM family methyltransferase